MLFCSAPLSSFVSGAIQVSHCDCDCDCEPYHKLTPVHVITHMQKPKPTGPSLLVRTAHMIVHNCGIMAAQNSYDNRLFNSPDSCHSKISSIRGERCTKRCDFGSRFNSCNIIIFDK